MAWMLSNTGIELCVSFTLYNFFLQAMMRPMFGVFGKAGRVNSIALYGLNKKVEAVGNVRRLTEFNMKLIDALQKIMVDQDRG